MSEAIGFASFFATSAETSTSPGAWAGAVPGAFEGDCTCVAAAGSCDDVADWPCVLATRSVQYSASAQARRQREVLTAISSDLFQYATVAQCFAGPRERLRWRRAHCNQKHLNSAPL